MDINDNQQVNTFLKGMNTDVSDALIDSSQYRYAENLRITTNKDSNTGELRLIEGGNIWIEQDSQILLKAYKIRDINVFITKNIDGQSWHIYKAKDNDTEMQLVLNGNISNISENLSLVGRYEDEDHVYLYIADGEHEIRQINICEKDQTTPINDSQIWSTLKCPMPKIKIVNLGDNGRLQSGKIQYAYRLYKKHGATSDISSPSNMVSIIHYNTSDTDIIKTNRQASIIKDTKGYKTNSATGKSAHIIIDGISDQILISQYDRLQVLRINYIQNGQMPTISIIYDNVIPDNSDIKLYDAIDNGDSIRTFSVSEYYETYNLGIKPKILESKDNYLLAANLSYLFEDVDELFRDEDFNAPQTNGSSSGQGNRIQWQIRSSDAYSLNVPEYDNNGNIKQVPSLRRGELYRFGIILYTKDGKKSSVKHIADINIPEDWPIYSYQSGEWKGSSIGIDFTLIGDTSDIGAWEIVRSVRKLENTRNITTGIFGYTMRAHKMEQRTTDGRGFDLNYNSGFLTGRLMYSENFDERNGDDPEYYVISSDSDEKLCFLASPEIVYDPQNTEDIINSNTTQIRINYWMQAENQDWVYNTAQSRKIDSLLPGYIQPHKQIFPISSSGNYTLNSIDHPYQLKVDGDRLNLLFDREDTASPSSDYYWRDIFHKQNISGQELCTSFNLIAPDSTSINYITSNLNNGVQILKTKIIDSPTPESAIQNGRTIFQDDTVVLRDKTFMRWSMFAAAYQISAYGHEGEVKDAWLTSDDSQWGYFGKVRTLSGSTGAGLLVATNEKVQPITNSGNYFPITIASIVKNAASYGDPKDYNYVQYGDYVVGQNTQTVFDGDCYIRSFEYNSLHAFYEPTYSAGVPFGAVVYQIPIETEIDLFGSLGCTLRNVLSNNEDTYYDIQDMECRFVNYAQDTPAYLYNSAYSADPTLTVVFGEDESDYRSRSGQYDIRIHASELKTNAETIDSWLKFKSMNYIDVDSRYGEITDMSLFKTHLVYWQDKATGILSVNERTIINDNDANQIVLGSGDVLQRFDYLSQLYGMKKNHFSKVSSDNALYWWDYDRKELLQYGGQNILPLIKTKGLTNYINDRENLLSNNPTLGFDNKYDELISYITDKSVVYNEGLGVFTSVYNIQFDESLPNDNTIRLCRNINNTIKVVDWNKESSNKSMYIDVELKPELQYVINKVNTIVKVFDITTFGGRFYKGKNEGLNNLTFTFDTPLKQHSVANGNNLITNREYDFRLAIPRNNNSPYGDRMRGKTMQCELKSSSNSTDFSLQYIITKYRMSWS